ncbi:DUF339-domain-containing protein [Xylariaceae sp. FL0662B]|nr:DUF339-domain-containing protein [Xylariaceae sp. FL0662B]
MASSVVSRSSRSIVILRSAHRGLTSPRFIVRRPLSTTTRALQADARSGNLPPMEPHKQRSQQQQQQQQTQNSKTGVGELEGADFRIEPMRRVGEDDKTMRARLVYQSRKRGILESDLLLSTFADKYLSSMTREQMAEYDQFLDENDWDIYYWATQEPPPLSSSSSSSSSPTTTTSGPSQTPTSTSPTPSAQETAAAASALNTTDTSSAAYAGGAEAALAAETTFARPTGGSERVGDATEGKEAPPNPTTIPTSTSTTGNDERRRAPAEGEWAQTVGTFKPAYRPVPARWRDSAVLALLREHVRERAVGGGGGMAFMPALKS